jgi:hypothetical protein
VLGKGVITGLRTPRAAARSPFSATSTFPEGSQRELLSTKRSTPEVENAQDNGIGPIEVSTPILVVSNA